jgi:hypothetical protein
MPIFDFPFSSIRHRTREHAARKQLLYFPSSACIEGPAVIQKILDHLDAKVALADIQKWPERRAPPQAVLLS